MSARRVRGEETPATFPGLLASREIMVFCGSGGVGKTSAAAATGAMAAARLGGRVLVMTVDPARRLATALGLEGIGNIVREVPKDVFHEAGIEPRGQLFAAMLDTKRSWDDLVHRYAPDEETAYQILDNPFYDNITGRFVNAHEFIAMERLYELHQSGEYDLIIVDTPPTRNAIDFLNAPDRMVEFFGGWFFKLLTLPYRYGGKRSLRLVDFASRPFYRLADRVLGSDFMQRLGEFFLNFQTMQEGFVHRAEEVKHLVHDRRTTFAVVTTLESAPMREAEFFCEKLDESEFHLGAMVCNRVLPEYLLDDEGASAAVPLQEADSVAGTLCDTFGDLPHRRTVSHVLETVADNYQNFAVVARREGEELRQLSTGPHRPPVLVSVPQLEDDVHDLAGLLQIGESLFA